MPVMSGKYPPAPPSDSGPEVIFENNSIEVRASQDDLVVLEPASLKVNHDPPKATTTTADDPYNLDHYLLTSSEGFSPFEQTLGDAPFHDKNGDPIWAALAYTEDGGAHPGKAAPPFKPTYPSAPRRKGVSFTCPLRVLDPPAESGVYGVCASG
jgi:hypothetical protein